MLFELIVVVLTMHLDRVLILILMEYALWAISNLENTTYIDERVLILILMEYALWVTSEKDDDTSRWES